MKLTTSQENGRLTVHIAGDLDHHGAGTAAREIEARIEAGTPRDCVLDMSGLTFMDSSGIALILRTYKRMRAMGGRIRVENVPEQPMRVLDASGIDRMVDISAVSGTGQAAGTRQGGLYI